MYYDIFLDLCEKKGVKPGRVSRETGISTATLTAWKQGKYTPKTDKLMKIAEYFEVDVSVFYQNESDVQNPGQQSHYNKETADIAQKVFESKELKLLFDAAADANPEDVLTAYDMLLALKRKEKND